MDDDRIWDFERSLWLGDDAQYDALVDDECVMVLPQPPFIFSGAEALEKVSNTPRWEEVAFSDQSVVRPQEGLIVIGYTAQATRGGGDAYEAHCTSTLRRLSHEEWRVVQHQQTVAPTAT